MMLLKNYLQVPQCAFFRKQLLSHRTLCCQARVRGVSVVRIHAKGRPESRPPVCFSGHQNLCSRLNTTFERLLLPTRSITKRMFAELSPSSEVLLSPISAPAPQFWVVVAVVVRSQMKRGANDSCALLPATVSASNAQTISGRSVRLAVDTVPASTLSVLSVKP